MLGKIFGYCKVVEVNGNFVKVKCSECLKDPELFGDAIFRIYKYTLLNGGVPCGCSRNYKYSKEQVLIRIHRKCRELGYQFAGFVDEYANMHTKLKLSCSNGHSWNSTTANKFINSNKKCKICSSVEAAKPRVISDEEYISRFESHGKYPQGTVFKKKSADVWSVFCPICYKDIYHENSVGDSIFFSTTAHLLEGKLPCRCSKNYSLSNEQLELRIKMVLREGENFKSFTGVGTGSYREVILECSEHGDYKTQAFRILHNGNRCPDCTKYGFNSFKDSVFYILKIRGEKEFIGFGITGNWIQRQIDHTRSLLKGGCYVTESYLFTMLGRDARELESSIKKSFDIINQGIPGFMTEAIAMERFNDIFCKVSDKMVTKYTHEIYEITDPTQT